MPGKKPDRRDFPPGKFGDEDFKKAMDAWELTYTSQGLPVPSASPSPATDKAAANQGPDTARTELTLDAQNRLYKRTVGYDQAGVDAANAQDKAQKAIADKAGPKTADNDPEPQAADFAGNMGAWSDARKKWRERHTGSKPLYPGSPK